MAENLKPCPFCGGEAATKVVVGGANDKIIIKVGCYDCSIWKHDSIISGSNLEKFDEALQNVVSNWNRRADDERKTD